MPLFARCLPFDLSREALPVIVLLLICLSVISIRKPPHHKVETVLRHTEGILRGRPTRKPRNRWQNKLWKDATKSVDTKKWCTAARHRSDGRRGGRRRINVP